MMSKTAPETPLRRSALRLHGLRRRWLFNTIAPVAAILLAIVLICSVGVSSYCYGSMQRGLESRAKAIAGSFNDYFLGGGYAGFYQRATQAASTYEDADRIELQFLSTNGQILVSSTSGLTAGLVTETPDVSAAAKENRIASFRGAADVTGEPILAVSHPLVFNGRVVGVMRLVTSMSRASRQVLLFDLVFMLLALLCFSLVFVSNLLFINNVVEPVAEVTEAAKRISNGSYGFQLENRYSDELGELVDNINNMSVQIGQNEKMKSEFISSVSHELRTPLTAINGWGETLLADPVGDPQTRRGIRIILNESQRLSTMVEELLEFSKMEDGRFALQIEPVDLAAALEDAIFTYRELFRQENILLEYEPIDELLPEIDGDPERLRQVFCNVFDNAAKHGGAGGRIFVELLHEAPWQIVKVRDYGPGIPEADLPFVKQKFYKGSSKARGSGIGLAVCDEIITLHGGSFDIGNADGGGAVVTIRLPEKNA